MAAIAAWRRVGRSMRFSLVSVNVVVLLIALAIYGVNPNFALAV